MNDQFPPIDWTIPPGTWPAWLPGSAAAGAPASWRVPMSGDAWNQGASVDASSERPSGRGILGHLGSELVQTPPMPAQSGGGWYRNSPSWVQSAMPLGANVGFSAAPAEPAYQPWADPISDKLGRSAWERPPSVPNWENPAPAPVVPRHGPDGWSYPGAQLDPTPPPPPRAFHTWLNDTLSNQNVRYYAGPGFYEALEKLAALTQLMPGSGSVQAWEDASHAREQANAGNYGKAATHTATGTANVLMDLVPGGKIAGIFGGMAARTFPWGKLPLAEALERAGRSVDEIWQATGLGRDALGKWRFEIPTRNYRINPNAGVLDSEGGRVAPFFEQHVYADLKNAYPEMAELESRIRIHPDAREYAAYTPGKKIEIEVPIRALLRARAIHEVEHGADFIEKFARGGAPLEFMGPGVTWEQAKAAYNNLAGEVAARNAVKRSMYMKEEQRRRQAPQSTERPPRSQQIIRFYPEE